MKSLLLYLLVAIAASAQVAGISRDRHQTTNWNRGLEGWRLYPAEKLNSCNANRLQPYYNNSVSLLSTAVPSYHNGVMYYQDFVGNVYAANVQTGAIKWRVFLPALTSRPAARTRNTPTLVPESDLLVFGDWTSGYFYAFRMSSGALVWSQLIDAHPNARFSQSPTVHNGVIYVGMSSGESGASSCVNLEICYFRGSMNALSLQTGAIIWRFFTVPELNRTDTSPSNQYAGGAVWGGSPTIDEERQLVWFGSGNNYRVPDSVYACTAAGTFDCDASNNYASSIIAVSMVNGDLVIARQFAESRWGYDAYTVACAIDGNPRGALPSCPPYSGLDADFAMAPILVSVRGNLDLAVAGNKAGMVYALNRDNGNLVWATKVGPDGMAAGGIAFGYAFDGKRLLFSNVNSGGVDNPSLDGRGVEWTLVNPAPGSALTTRGGFWSALNPRTGAILWQRAEPNGARIYGWISAFKSVFVSGSFSLSQSNLFVIKTSTGAIVRSMFNMGSRFAALAPYRGIYCGGNGYLGQSFYRSDNKLYCYKLQRATRSEHDDEHDDDDNECPADEEDLED